VSEKEQQMRLGLSDGVRDGWAVANSSLADLVHERVDGPTGMLHVLIYVALWGKFFDLTGREPSSGRELAAAMQMPNKTLSRYRLRFISAFPELESPAPLWEVFGQDIAEDDPPDVVAFKLGGAST